MWKITISVTTMQNQINCVSFYYLLGEEYMRRIVFLREQKKIVEFWSCC